MRWRWLAIVFGLLVVTAVIAGYRIARGISWESLRPLMERELSEGIGLAVEIAGTPRIELTPALSLVVEDVRVANLPDRPSETLLRIGRLELELDVLALLDRMVVIEALELSDVELRIEPDVNGRFGLRPDPAQLDEAAAEVEADPVRLEIHRLKIEDLEISIDPYGEGDVTTLAVAELEVESANLESPLEIETRGTFEGGEFEVLAETGSLKELVAGSHTFPLDVRARFFDARLEASGTIEDLATLRGAALRFDLALLDPALRARDFGIELPALGSVAMSGRFVEHEGIFALEQLSARADGQGDLSLDIEGNIRDLLRLEGVDLRARVGVSDVGALEAWTSLSLPGVPLRAELEFDDDDGSLGVEADAELARPGVLELDLEGVFDDLRRFRELDLRVDLSARTLETIAQAVSREGSWPVPPVGPVRAKARVVAEGERIGLEDIEIEVGSPSAFWAQADGSIGDVLAMRDVALEVRAGAASARRVAALFDREIPELGRLTTSFSIRDDDGSLGLENAVLAVGREGEFSLEVSGAFDDLSNLDEIAFDAVLGARDLSILGALVELDLPAVGPVRFEGTLGGADERMQGRGRLWLRETLVEGEVIASMPADARPTLDLQLRSPRVHLPDLVENTRAVAATRRASEPDTFDLAAWWGGDEPLPIDMLGVLDASFELAVERVTGVDQLRLEAVRLSGRLEDGHLQVDDLGADYESGRVSARLEIDARPQPPKSQLEVEAFNVDLTRLMSQFQASTEYAGLLDLSIKLETEGVTAPEIRSNLQGFFGAMLREGAIVNRYSKALSFDVLRVSIPSFRASADTEAPVHCMLAISPIENGVLAVDTLYLEGDKITINGDGEIDLGRDRLDMRLTPRVRKPGLVSISATVDLSGPIANPVIRPIRRSMVTSALAAVYRNAMRAPRAIQRAVRGSRSLSAEDDPCGLVARQRVRHLRTQETEPIDVDSAVDTRDAVDQSSRIGRDETGSDPS